MAILICGGAGYIGSHTAKRLAEKGHEVVVLDNLSKGHKEFAQFGDFVLGDIGDSALLDLVLSKYKIEAAMHFCAFIEVGESVKDPQPYYQNNAANTLNLMTALRRHGVNKMIFSSTAAVYGIPEKTPILEDDLKAPINPYGQSKLMVEHFLEDFNAAYDFRSVRFRYFNAAGADPSGLIGEAHSPESHLIPLILDAAMGRRADIKIFGTDYPTPDGTAVRDYVHVNDLAEAHALGVEYLLKGGKSEVFNLGSGSGYSVKEVIDQVKSVTGKQFKVTEVERRAGDPPSLVASSDKAKKILGWQPKISLKEIVENAWAWHQKRFS